ncbi:unnamed protein product [Cochlearia groenlandica]
MENNKNPKNHDDSSNHIPRNTHQNIDDSMSSRSYICSFCIRGFSNAQALGGHMNIHRRDRANLRQKLMDQENKDDVVAETDSSSEVVSIDLNEQQQQEKALACDDDQEQDVDKDISPGKKIGFWVQESKIGHTNDDGEDMDVSIDGSSHDHHDESEGLDLELRLGQRAVEKKKT